MVHGHHFSIPCDRRKFIKTAALSGVTFFSSSNPSANHSPISDHDFAQLKNPGLPEAERPIPDYVKENLIGTRINSKAQASAVWCGDFGIVPRHLGLRGLPEGAKDFKFLRFRNETGEKLWTDLVLFRMDNEKFDNAPELKLARSLPGKGVVGRFAGFGQGRERRKGLCQFEGPASERRKILKGPRFWRPDIKTPVFKVNSLPVKNIFGKMEVDEFITAAFMARV